VSNASEEERVFVVLGEIWRREYIYICAVVGRPEGKRKAWGEWENAAQAGSWKGRDAVGGGSPEFDDRWMGCPNCCEYFEE
jgi:hypothetical protein